MAEAPRQADPQPSLYAGMQRCRHDADPAPQGIGILRPRARSIRADLCRLGSLRARHGAVDASLHHGCAAPPEISAPHFRSHSQEAGRAVLDRSAYRRLVGRSRPEGFVRNFDRAATTSSHVDIGARVMLAVLGLIWGITWPVMKIALNEIPPLTMRGTTAVLGAVTYYTLCVVMQRSLHIPSLRVWGHVLIASLLNVVAFSLFSAFAQLAATTSRVAILAYTMPIWAVLLAWAFLGERPNRLQAIALLLCATGLAILIYPLAANGIPRGIVFAVAIGVCWAGGTVYLKWAQIPADQMSVGSWQLTVAAVILVAAMLIFDGPPHFREVHLDGALALAWTGIASSGTADALWFAIIRRLPAITASLGVLASPVIGVVGSFFMLGEVPTSANMTGFALIFVASACVLLNRQRPRRAVRASVRP